MSKSINKTTRKNYAVFKFKVPQVNSTNLKKTLRECDRCFVIVVTSYIIFTVYYSKLAQYIVDGFVYKFSYIKNLLHKKHRERIGTHSTVNIINEKKEKKHFTIGIVRAPHLLILFSSTDATKVLQF